jgi:hypothetical protein
MRPRPERLRRFGSELKYKPVMPDDLRQSVEDLEAPACPDCHLKMKWYRSIRVSQSPLVIDHFFMCDSCGRVDKRRSGDNTSSSRLPPGQLSLPFEHRAVA